MKYLVSFTLIVFAAVVAGTDARADHACKIDPDYFAKRIAVLERDSGPESAAILARNVEQLGEKRLCDTLDWVEGRFTDFSADYVHQKFLMSGKDQGLTYSGGSGNLTLKGKMNGPGNLDLDLSQKTRNSSEQVTHSFIGFNSHINTLNYDAGTGSVSGWSSDYQLTGALPYIGLGGVANFVLVRDPTFEEREQLRTNYRGQGTGSAVAAPQPLQTGPAAVVRQGQPAAMPASPTVTEARRLAIRSRLDPATVPDMNSVLLCAQQEIRESAVVNAEVKKRGLKCDKVMEIAR